MFELGENQPRHQPHIVPAKIANTTAPTTASLIAKRRIRRATNSATTKSNPTTTTTAAIVNPDVIEENEIAGRLPIAYFLRPAAFYSLRGWSS
jgi:hypothetical protein